MYGDSIDSTGERRFEISPALHIHGRDEENGKVDSRAPPFPGWKGGCGAAGKGVKPEKANMRLIAK
jgi:hypothetical protein